MDVTITGLTKLSKETVHLEVPFGEAVSEGKAVYQKTSSGLYHIAHCETSMATSLVAGLLLDSVVEDAYQFIAVEGPVDVGAALLSQGDAYYLSVNGLLMPESDLATGDWVTYLGQARTTQILDLSIKPFAFQVT